MLNVNNQIINFLLFFEVKLNKEDKKKIFPKMKSQLIDIKVINEINVTLFINEENELSSTFSKENNLFTFKTNQLYQFLFKYINKKNMIEFRIYINNQKIKYKENLKISNSEIEYVFFFFHFIIILLEFQLQLLYIKMI